jgi:two-component system sensor histidine kinase YesM
MQGDEICLTVEDNGNGMTGEELDNLLSEDEKVPKHGSGVGVINVHNRIRLLFGQRYGITAESEPDEGTTITVHLPAILYSEEKRREMEQQMKRKGERL